MSKFCITSILIAIITLTAMLGATGNTNSAEYLRIHIRANSNSAVDQSVKYEIKSVIVDYLTPMIANVNSKTEAVNLLENSKVKLEGLIDGVLKNKGLLYKSNVAVRNEKFPTRVYGDFTLEEGFYDAVIVELGEAKGDNWWCVIYPPLCFADTEKVTYKSKIKEIIAKFKSRA